MHNWSLLQPGQFGIVDLVDILVVGFLIYRILLLIRGTRGMQVTLGIIFLALLYYGSRLAQLKTLQWILANFLTYIVFAIIVIYQAEIRRGLANIGRNRFLRRFSREVKKEAFDEIVLAATTLASRKRYIENSPPLSHEIEAAILAGEVCMNMTEMDVEASIGRPDHVNRDTFKFGTRTHFCYDSIGSNFNFNQYRYVYFENGKVTSWSQ